MRVGCGAYQRVAVREPPVEGSHAYPCAIGDVFHGDIDAARSEQGPCRCQHLVTILTGINTQCAHQQAHHTRQIPTANDRKRLGIPRHHHPEQIPVERSQNTPHSLIIRAITLACERHAHRVRCRSCCRREQAAWRIRVL